MSLSARVLDAETLQPLPNATIYSDGVPVAAADKNGNFYIDNPGMNISASFVGYDTNNLPEGVVADDAQIRLQKSSGELTAVSVIAKVKSNPLPYIAAGSILFLLLTAKKKKTMAGMNTNTILLIGAGLVGVYLLTRPRTAAVPQYPVYPGQPSPYGYPAQNQTAADISAAGGAASSVIDALSHIFGGASGGSGGSATDFSAV